MDTNPTVPENTEVERVDVNHWAKGGLSRRYQQGWLLGGLSVGIDTTDQLLWKN